MKPATELIHAGGAQRGRRRAPLTTRSTRRPRSSSRTPRKSSRNEGGRRSISIRATAIRPSSASNRARGARPQRARAAVFLGPGRHDDHPDGARQRETKSSAAPRSTAARCTCCTICCPGSASPRDSCRWRNWPIWAVSSGRTRIVWFESPINPTARCVDVARIAEACRARAFCRSSTIRSPVPSTSSRLRSASTWRCRARRISQRPQRRHGGVVTGRAAPRRSHRESPAARRHVVIPCRPTRSGEAEDAASGWRVTTRAHRQWPRLLKRIDGSRASCIRA